MVADVDQWIDIAKECKYLPENDLKVLFFTFEYVRLTFAVVNLFPFYLQTILIIIRLT
jgi:hypothetical protein